MGGVADALKLATLETHSIANGIYNVYSENDSVLKYILKCIKFSLIPCGKNINKK
jgi:hypothetical protein